VRRAPRFEERRQAEFGAELRARAQVWLPEWSHREGTGDFAGAIFKIAARFASEVAQRLDRVPEKNFRGFLHWLGVRAAAARAARIPIALVMTPGSPPTRADPPVQFQALGAAEPVIFETTDALTLTPAALQAVVGADPAGDRYYLPPPALLSLDAPPTLPSEWELASAADAGAVWLQLEPALGLEKGTLIQSGPGAQYAIVDAKGGLFKIEPPLAARLEAGARRFTRVDEFEPFTGARDAQRHAIYVGSKTAFAIETKAVIELKGWETLPGADELEWAYWGKASDTAEPEWLTIERAEESPQLLLLKGDGKIEETEVGGQKSRWLRATRKSGLSGPAASTALTPVRVLVNCDPEHSWPPDAVQHYAIDAPPPAEVEGFANTTPLVLNTAFHPFGRQPRVFDAFYLGSREAFSKPGASVTLDFRFGDEWSSEPVAVSVAANQHFLCGVSVDGALRIVTITDGATPTVTFHNPTQPPGSHNNPIALVATARPGIAFDGTFVYVTTSSAEGEVFFWRGTFGAVADGTWTSLGRPGDAPGGPSPPPASPPPVETAITIPGGVRAYAIAAGELLQCDLAGTRAWQRLDSTYAGVPIDLRKIAPVLGPGASGSAGYTDELVGVGADGRVYLRIGAPAWQRVTLAARFASTSYPLAIRHNLDRVRCWCVEAPAAPGGPDRLVAFDVDVAASPFAVVGTEVFQDLDLAGDGLVVVQTLGGPVVAFLAVVDGAVLPGHWDAFAAPSEPPLLGESLGAFDARQRGPGAFSTWFAAPAARGALRLLNVDSSLHVVLQNAWVRTVAIVAGGALPAGGYVLDLTPDDDHGKTFGRVRRREPLTDGREALFLQRADSWVNQDAAMAVDAYTEQTGDVFTITFGGSWATTDAVAGGVGAGTFVRIRWGSGAANSGFAELETVEPDPMTPGRTTIEFHDPLPLAAQAAASIDVTPLQRALSLTALTRPGLRSNRLAVRELVDAGLFTASALTPTRRRAISTVAASGWVVLEGPWEPSAPGGPRPQVVADAVISGAQAFAPAQGNNPDLSWEYWDGNGWWQIERVDDGTRDLVASGHVRFCVPRNIAATEVVGRNNFWVRARLVGGDYGQETVQIVTTPGPGAGESTQKVDRNTDSIRAPHVAALTVSYSICCPTVPDLVLTSDGGNVLDRSAANRIDGNSIEALAPLRRSLGAADDSLERALFLGFDSAVVGKSVSLLFLLEEGTHAGAFPVRVDVLQEHGYEPVASTDGTQGLDEDGTLTLSFDAPPVRTRLFGRSLYWLRIRPRAGFADEWNPVVRKVFVNAAWARATEQQMNELLGSSDGRPGLQVSLARPPVIEDTLSLRVLERLSDEDMTELNEAEKDVVKEARAAAPGVGCAGKRCPTCSTRRPRIACTCSTTSLGRSRSATAGTA
jgi:hypothetical protein